jgi:hypothetical protein
MTHIQSFKNYMEQHPKLRQWSWFFLLYFAGMFSVAIIAYGIRLLLHIH